MDVIVERQDMAIDLVRLMDRVEMERAVLLGHSMGKSKCGKNSNGTFIHA